jgi:hypothetical protein
MVCCLVLFTALRTADRYTGCLKTELRELQLQAAKLQGKETYIATKKILPP